jgi:hypothetical protein
MKDNNRKEPNKNNRTESKQEHPHAHETATSAPDLNKNIAPHRNNNKPHRIDTRMSAQQASIARMGIRGSVSP